MLKKGFTLIEMLIVIGIISALVMMETFVYLNSQKSARDGRRKADVENVRAALEQYRSTNNTYPSSLTFNASCTVNSAFTDAGGNTYMSPLPSDPRCQIYKYYYTALPSGCNESPIICNNYTLGAFLEQTSTSCVVTGTDCKNEAGAQNCNYCLGPYGQK